MGVPSEKRNCGAACATGSWTERLMSRTRDGVFMHCLPVRRNVVVSDEVLDGPRSIVVEQAANRLHIQKTLLSLIL